VFPLVVVFFPVMWIAPFDSVTVVLDVKVFLVIFK